MCERREKSKTSKYQIFLANTLELRLHIRSIDSHTIVVFCMRNHVDGWVSTVANRQVFRAGMNQDRSRGVPLLSW